MRYALLICSDENSYAGLTEEEESAVMARYGQFQEEMTGRGVLQGGARLRPTSDSTTVRVRYGDTRTSDGPSAETKEQIGGFYLVDCKDLDEAIEIAAKIPTAALGSI